jgi:hypothetical protein
MPNRDQLNAAVARELRAASATQQRRSSASSPRPAGRSVVAGPGRWLYPLDTTARFRKLLESKGAGNDVWWPLKLNFPWIRPGDFVYFYTHDDNAGIVGFAKVKATGDHMPQGASIKLEIDVAVSKALMAGRPLSAATMARWLHPPQGPVEDLRAAIQDLDSALAGVPAYAKRLRDLRRGT